VVDSAEFVKSQRHLLSGSAKSCEVCETEVLQDDVHPRDAPGRLESGLHLA
jgi:hypothetical protein